MGPSAIKSNDRLTAVTLPRAHANLREHESVVWRDGVHMTCKLNITRMERFLTIYSIRVTP